MATEFEIKDTKSSIIPDFPFKGIKRIEIPKIDDDFTVSNGYGLAIIKKYLPSILQTHKENADKIKYLFDYYLGVQDIRAKERLYQKDAQNNHKEVENNAYRQVTFKRGFLTGEQREYTHKSDSNSDDLVYLDRYFTDCNFFSKDKDLKEWIYATGIGATYTAPRTDIIIPDGVDELTKKAKFRFATAKDGYDVNTEAPFTFATIDPKENFVVYSSRFDKTPLFCVEIVDIDDSKPDEEPLFKKQIHIETRYASFVVKSELNFSNLEDVKLDIEKELHYLPIVEHSVNRSRMGIVELNRDIFNLVNTLDSSVTDMVVDNANVILVFKNTDISSDDVKEMKKAGAIIISDAQNARQGSTAGLDTIKIEIPFDGLNQFVEKKLTNAYDIAGVPLASGQVTSGGDTGQARLLGGGWNNAYIVINDDINSLKGSDYDVLKLILLICKQVPECPLNELNASQIDIKYRINQNDNFLVKTQGIMNLYNVNMPKKEIVKVSGLFSDVTTTAKEWEIADAQAKEEQNQSEQETDNDEQKNIGFTDGNNSQE